MSKVNYVIVIGSKNYRELIYSTIKRNEILQIHPIEDEEKQLLPYIVANASDISNYDAIIIDLGSLKDTDEEIMKAVETIRFLDDYIRIIIIAGSRENCEGLLHKCFLNGIYNLIMEDSYINIRSSLEKCLLDGMSYRDALDFKDEEELRKLKFKDRMKQTDSVRKKIAFAGTQARVGVSHCVMAAAYTLRSCGYLVAVVDGTGSPDYYNIMRSYQMQLNTEGYFTLEEIDFYIKPSFQDICSDSTHNYILYDFGQQSRLLALPPSEAEAYQEADMKILVCGGKSWEIPMLSEVINAMKDKNPEPDYLFNLTDTKNRNGIVKMMKNADIQEKKVHFMEYQAEPFERSDSVMELLSLQKRENQQKGMFGLLGRSKKGRK